MCTPGLFTQAHQSDLGVSGALHGFKGRSAELPRWVTTIILIILVAALAGLPTLGAAPAHAAAGDLDPTFGGDGTVTTAGFTDDARAVAIQPDGKIISAGGAGTDFGLARYNPDGSLDPSFGDVGLVRTDFAGGADQALAVTIQPDGKIVAAGRAFVGGNHDFALARYHPDGSLDPASPVMAPAPPTSPVISMKRTR